MRRRSKKAGMPASRLFSLAVRSHLTASSRCLPITRRPGGDTDRLRETTRLRAVGHPRRIDMYAVGSCCTSFCKVYRSFTSRGARLAGDDRCRLEQPARDTCQFATGWYHPPPNAAVEGTPGKRRRLSTQRRLGPSCLLAAARFPPCVQLSIRSTVSMVPRRLLRTRLGRGRRRFGRSALAPDQ